MEIKQLVGMMTMVFMLTLKATKSLLFAFHIETNKGNVRLVIWFWTIDLIYVYKIIYITLSFFITFYSEYF